MYVMYAVMYMTQQQVTQTVVLLQEQLSRIFPMIGLVLFAVLARVTSRQKNKKRIQLIKKVTSKKASLFLYKHIVCHSYECYSACLKILFSMK